MKIPQNAAFMLETVVRKVFACERGGMGGYINSDHFKSAPFDAALIALAPLWKIADPKELEELLSKWEYILRDNTDCNCDINSFIQELGSFVDALIDYQC